MRVKVRVRVRLKLESLGREYRESGEARRESGWDGTDILSSRIRHVIF